MTQQEKIQIVEHLRVYVEQRGSQNKAAKSLKGVSSATLSHLLNGEWENIADDMFRKIAAQIGCSTNDWQLAPTTNTQMLTDLLIHSQSNSLVFAVIGNAGSGKSTAFKVHSNANKNVFRVECGQYWDRKHFLQEVLRSMGRESFSVRIADMMLEIVQKLKSLYRPQLIIDEVDKLDDKVLLFLITLYNELGGHCSIIISATHFLRKRIKDGLRLRRKGYEEIYSRFGGSFFELEDTSYEDVKKVCEANGITDQSKIKRIAQGAKGDLRSVYNNVFAIKIDESRLQ